MFATGPSAVVSRHENLLELVTDDKAGWRGIFPELVLFDCHALP